MYEIEYFELESGAQPAEDFEDTTERKLLAKLNRYTIEVSRQGPTLGGGIIKSCRDYANLFEIRARHHNQLAREFCAFDDRRLVLLDGLVKAEGEATPKRSFDRAMKYLTEYQRTRKVSPEQEDEEEDGSV